MNTQSYTNHSGTDAAKETQLEGRTSGKQSPCLTKGTQAPSRRALLSLDSPSAPRRPLRSPEQLAHERAQAREKRYRARAWRAINGSFVARECGVRFIPAEVVYDPRRAEKSPEKREPLTDSCIRAYRQEAIHNLTTGPLRAWLEGKRESGGASELRTGEGTNLRGGGDHE